MRILLVNQKNDFKNQIAIAWLQSFNKEMTAVATGLRGETKIDAMAVKVMKAVGINLSSDHLCAYEACLNQNWDYIIIINRCIEVNDKSFSGNVLHWTELALNECIPTNAADGSIENHYIEVREKLRYPLLRFYLTTINQKEMLGSDSCGIECDLY